MHVSHPVLLSVLHADNIAPISAGRLVMLVFSRVYRLLAFCLSLQIALIDLMQSCAICELHKRLCFILTLRSTIDVERELSLFKPHCTSDMYY